MQVLGVKRHVVFKRTTEWQDVDLFQSSGGVKPEQCSLCCDYFAGWKAEESWFISRRENLCRHPRSLLLNGQRMPFPTGYSGRDVNVITHPHLVARLSKNGTKPPLSLGALTVKGWDASNLRPPKQSLQTTAAPLSREPTEQRPPKPFTRTRNQTQFPRLCVLSEYDTRQKKPIASKPRYRNSPNYAISRYAISDLRNSQK